MSETVKALPRREKEKFFELYCNGKGIDIGCGNDLLRNDSNTLNCVPYDHIYGHGDATFMNGIASEVFDYVHSSHCLEHIMDIDTALKNWWRILKPGGYLLLLIPERDLYEKKKTLPSRWNEDHKHFFLIGFDEAPCTIDIVPRIGRVLAPLAEGVNFKILQARTLMESPRPPEPHLHSDGEYSIEIIVKKLK